MLLEDWTWNSGALNARLTQPRFAHPRTYWAQVERIPDETALRQLRDGVELSDGRTRPAKVELLPNIPIVNGQPLSPRSVPIRERKTVPTAWLQLTLTEGRNRQVRRMTAAVGYPTLRLVRWSIGAITLEGLQPGEVQRVDDEAVRALWKRIMEPPRRKDRKGG
jgi:23S rRNA pseudouridine2457 synthase